MICALVTHFLMLFSDEMPDPNRMLFDIFVSEWTTRILKRVYVDEISEEYESIRARLYKLTRAVSTVLLAEKIEQQRVYL